MPCSVHTSQRPRSSVGVSMAPVGFEGDDMMSPFSGRSPASLRRRTSASSSLAVTWGIWVSQGGQRGGDGLVLLGPHLGGVGGDMGEPGGGGVGG